jgi:acetyltransferase-like isoleucine patch superfamily enzyme
MPMHPATFLRKALASIEHAAFQAELRALRRGGHRIAEDLRFGPRVQLTVAPGASLVIERGVDLVQDAWIILEPGDEMVIGERVFISQHCTISGSVRIGADTLIAGYVTIIDANHRFDRADIPIREQGGRKQPICIGEDVWIGASSVVLPGVRIGAHTIVGANSTVTHDLPESVIAAGSPARIIRWRNTP